VDEALKTNIYVDSKVVGKWSQINGYFYQKETVYDQALVEYASFTLHFG